MPGLRQAAIATMRVSKKAQCGTRAMLELALHYGRGVVSLSHIARSQGISLKYLEQVMTPLRRAGMVEATRGAGGGYRLTRPPGEIRVGELIRALKEPMEPVECLEDGRHCDRVSRCQARTIWSDLHRIIETALDRITLQEILDRAPANENPGATPEALPSKP